MGVALYYLSSQTERREKTGRVWDNVINYTWRRLHYHNRGTHRRGILNRILYDRTTNAKNKSRPYARHPRRVQFLTNVTGTIERHEAEQEIGTARKRTFLRNERGNNSGVTLLSNEEVILKRRSRNEKFRNEGSWYRESKSEEFPNKGPRTMICIAQK